MESNIYSAEERAKIVAKDILAATEMASHPNITYRPSKQLKELMDDEEIVKSITYLKRQRVLFINERSIYLGGRIQTFPAYELQTDESALKEFVNPVVIALSDEEYRNMKRPKFSNSLWRDHRFIITTAVTVLAGIIVPLLIALFSS